jgi:hypothetical protein
MLYTLKLSNAEYQKRFALLEEEKERLKKNQEIERGQATAAIHGLTASNDATKERRNGNIIGAQYIEESAAKEQDEADRPALERKYLDMGFKPEEAKGKAESEIGSRQQKRATDQGEERQQVKFTGSAAGGADAAEKLRIQATEEETHGHQRQADILREAATRTEKAATLQQRITEKSRNEGISKEEAEKKVNAADKEEQKGREIEFVQREKKRDLMKQGLASENKARQMELSGNTEGAARERDKQTAKEREEALKKEGLDEKEAHKQANKEMFDAQRKRQQSQEQEDNRPKPDFRQKVTSLQKIGGGGAVYGAGSHTPRDFMKRMDTIIQYLHQMHEGQQVSAGQNNALHINP